MKTLKDVRVLLKGMETKMVLCGVTPGFREEFLRKAREVGSAITAENDLQQREGVRLPDETVLGTKSEELFSAFTEWVSKNEAPE